MKRFIFFLFNIIFVKHLYSLIFWGAWYVEPFSSNEYSCEISRFVKISWNTTEVNINHFEIRRKQGDSGNWITITSNIDACGTCSHAHYVYEDHGPFIPGVKYYYRIVAVGNWGHVDLHDVGFIKFAVSVSKDWKKQTTSNVVINGSTPNDRNAYSWHEESNNMQGVIIDLVPTEKVPIYLQSNNHIISFQNPYYYFTYISVKINDNDWITLYDGQSYGNTFLWQNSISYFNSTGHDTLKVKFMVSSSSTIYDREYDVYVIPPSQRLFKDNYCNTLRCWKSDNPNAIPVLFSEGFDAYDCTTQEFYYWAAQDIFSCLQANGYDVYLLDYRYGSQDIRNNAAVFDAAVRYVSSLYGNQPLQAAGGASMGGVVARYAFAKAEQENIPLPAKKFVSIDSPQQGAVVSKDVQDYMKQQYDDGNLDAFGIHSINNMAAKELSIYNPLDPNTETPNSIHNTFYHELNSLNGDGYPHLTENIGISFSTNTPNPNNGVWLIIHRGWLSDIEFELKDDGHGNNEMAPGSYLPLDLTNMAPTTKKIFYLLWTTVSMERKKDPTYIPYNSALDIVNGQSKFDVTIIPEHTTYHDVVPEEIVDDIVNAIIYGNTKYLQNKIETSDITYSNYKNIIAGRNVTNKIPVGDYIIQNGTTVKFIAGESIDLEDGFVVEEGATFDATIQPMDIIHCNSTNKNCVRKKTHNKLTVNKTSNNMDFDCYPNPFKDNFTISINSINNSYSKIYIENFLGKNIKTIYEGKLYPGENRFNVNFTTFASGLYFCILENNKGEKQILKIIKQ